MVRYLYLFPDPENRRDSLPCVVIARGLIARFRSELVPLKIWILSENLGK